MKKLCIFVLLVCMCVLAFDGYVLAGKVKKKRHDVAVSTPVPARNVYNCIDEYSSFQIKLGPGSPPGDLIGSIHYVCTKGEFFPNGCPPYVMILTLYDHNFNQLHTVYINEPSPQCSFTQNPQITMSAINLYGPGFYFAELDVYYGTAGQRGNLIGYVGMSFSM